MVEYIESILQELDKYKAILQLSGGKESTYMHEQKQLLKFHLHNLIGTIH